MRVPLLFIVDFMMKRLCPGERLRMYAPWLCLGCAILASCAVADSGTPFRRDQFHRANVLLVTIDTLRADRLGVYGNRDGLTPALDGLAKAGVRYARAMSHAPMTLPSHTSILTGLSPRQNGVRNNTTFRLDDRVPTIATFLKKAGYRTGAFVGAFVLGSRFGLAKDFDVYDDRLPHDDRASFHFAERRGDEVVKAATDWILGAANKAAGPVREQPTRVLGRSAPVRGDASAPERAPVRGHPREGDAASEPWFAWVHLFDPHAPYVAPPEYRTGRTPYDAEVAYADAMIGRLVESLHAAGQIDRTLILVTADHGESLGEHGETTHGLFAYESTIHVPMIVSGPAVRPAVVESAVAHVDIVPTILDLVGVAIPPSLEGRSLVDPVPADRTLYFEALDAYLTRGWAPLRGVVRNGWKYIDLPEAELYDLASDPGEAHNAIGRGDRATGLQKALAALDSGRDTPAAAVPLDADAANRLRSLGYVGGTAPTRAAPTVSDDPKRLVALNEQFNSALTAFEEGRGLEALQGFAGVLSARPDFASARTSAATVLLSQRRAGEAVRLLREAPAGQRESPQILAKLGAALRDAGDLGGAVVTLEQAHRVDDGNVDVMADLAVVYAAQGRTEDARRVFNEVAKRNPSAATTWYNLGLFELQSRRPAAAVTALRQAVDREPSYGEAWQALGAALARSDPAGALNAWRHAERLLPHDYDLLFNLGMLTAQSPRPEEAIPYLRRFVQEAPRDQYAADITRVQRELMTLERHQ
jgi:arylsulfatase A-like enzyme/Flp pilus assembly protein TadD